jgi:hypothetical protein
MTYLVDHEGITSFKLFMAYPGVFYSDDGQILRAMQTAGEDGSMIMMHAENGIAIDVLVAQALARGETDPMYHSLTRPAELEGEATHRAIELAKVAGQRAALHRAHVGERGARRGRRRPHLGLNVFAETCPQYLYLTLEDHLDAARLRGREVGVLHAGAHQARPPPERSVEGAAHERAGDRVDRPLPVLHEGPEGPRPRRLLEDPERHRFGRAPHGAALPGRRHRRAHARALGRDVLHHPARMFGLYKKGAIAPGMPTPTSWCGTPTGTPSSASTTSTT